MLCEDGYGSEGGVPTSDEGEYEGQMGEDGEATSVCRYIVMVSFGYPVLRFPLAVPFIYLHTAIGGV